MPCAYYARRFRTTKTVFNAIPPRKIQVAVRIRPVSVNPARIAKIAYTDMAAIKRRSIRRFQRFGILYEKASCKRIWSPL
jgi:hypothetical protein